MPGYHGPIEDLTINNDNFRQVLYTGKFSQLVLMTIAPSDDIGAEVHEGHDQFFRFEAGVGQVIIDGTTYDVKDGDAVVVPSGADHNVINTSATEPLKLYTIYSPAEHPDGTVFATKAEALAGEHQ
jgi:mannose-6-phosphate isomerase-like protein (cupin superfamily)